MIKEKPKKERFGVPKTRRQILLGYGRTILLSFTFAFIFTVLLSIHARCEMIKNIYANQSEQIKFNEQIARQLIQSSDYMQDLKKKKYAVCMKVGNIYFMAGDYANAQIAYELALEKSKFSNYNCYYKLTKVLIAQNKINEAQELINSVKDISDKNLIKFKSRAYIEMGDKYYSNGKYLKAAKSYEIAEFYYSKFSKRDKVVVKSIHNRIINAYMDAADLLAQSDLSKEAVKYLLRAHELSPDDFNIRYKLAIIYSDLDPLKSVSYFEQLVKEQPQNIDYAVVYKALVRTANIMDLEQKFIEAKRYRYKIHSLDLLVDNKVVYKNDVEVMLDKFIVKKSWFTYKIENKYHIKNISKSDINNLSAEFVLRKNNKELERVMLKCVNKQNPLYSFGGVSNEINVKFHKHILTQSELSQYYVDIYLYKDARYKTLINTIKVPQKSVSYV